MSGFLLAGAGFFLVSVIIEGVITGYEGIYGAFFNFIGSILLFGAIAAELEAGRWGINAQKIPNLIGGLWTTAGFCIMIGQVSLAWSQKFQGVWIVVSYVISFIGSIFLTAAGAMRTDHVIEKHEDITKYFDTLAGKFNDFYCVALVLTFPKFTYITDRHYDCWIHILCDAYICLWICIEQL
jgi:hypothetical protein